MKYVDADPGPGAADFTCGGLSDDSHKGTDFALPSFAAMKAGVDVLAAAPGRVKAVRDGMPDTGFDGTPAEMLEGKDCGNGVVIDHGAGWETQYCHLAEGSVTVGTGQRVTMGAVLGQVGYSGMTAYPHVHLSVRQDGRVVDPFNTDEITLCGGDDGPEDDLWLAPIGYVPGGIASVGITGAPPGFEAVREGAAAPASVAADGSSLVGWAYLWQARPGDEVVLTLTDPDGVEWYRRDAVLDAPHAWEYLFGGRKLALPASPGLWSVEAVLSRDGVELARRSATTTVE